MVTGSAVRNLRTTSSQRFSRMRLRMRSSMLPEYSCVISGAEGKLGGRGRGEKEEGGGWEGGGRGGEEEGGREGGRRREMKVTMDPRKKGEKKQRQERENARRQKKKAGRDGPARAT